VLVHYGPGKTPRACPVVDDADDLIGIYLAGIPDEGDMDNLERRARIAKVIWPTMPTIGYWPRAAQAGRVPAVDVVGVEAYRGVSERIGDFEARIRRAIGRCPRAAILAQTYTSNAAYTTDLISLLPIYAWLARLPQVEFVLGFSGRGRATGLQDHPDAAVCWGRLAERVRTPEPESPPSISFTEGDLMLLSQFTDPLKGLLAVKTVKPLAGHAGIFTLVLPDDRVYSMQSDGTDGDRDPGTDGPWERCRVSGNVATFLSAGTYYTRAFVVVEGL
jgi:hypothetical protein